MPNRFSGARVVAILIVGCVLLGLLIQQIMPPFRQAVARRYAANGEQLLKTQNFDQAVSQFEQALQFDPQNTEAISDLPYAQAGRIDIAQALPFFERIGDQTLVQKIISSRQNYTNPKAALSAGYALYQNHDYAFARYPFEQAVKLDPGYSEAWHYLSLTYDQLATAATDPTIKNNFMRLATAARAKRDHLTTKYLSL